MAQPIYTAIIRFPDGTSREVKNCSGIAINADAGSVTFASALGHPQGVLFSCPGLFIELDPQSILQPELIGVVEPPVH